MAKKTKKKEWTSNNEGGWLCSGYGVFPGGEKCKGCIDCGCKPVSYKQAIETFNRNHFVGTAKQFLKKYKLKK